MRAISSIRATASCPWSQIWQYSSILEVIRLVVQIRKAINESFKNVLSESFHPVHSILVSHTTPPSSAKAATMRFWKHLSFITINYNIVSQSVIDNSNIADGLTFLLFNRFYQTNYLYVMYMDCLWTDGQCSVCVYVLNNSQKLLWDKEKRDQWYYWEPACKSKPCKSIPLNSTREEQMHSRLDLIL